MAVPTVAVGSVTAEAGVVQASGVAVTVMLNVPEMTTGVLAWSVTWIVKVYVPAAPVTVPEMTPVELIVMPVGSEPEVMVKVLVPVPPATTMVAPA